MSRPTGDSPPRMRGATASVAGSRGIVPKPTAGQHNFMLLGDGTWGAQPVAGLPSQTSNSGKLLTTDGTNAAWTTTAVLTSLTSPAGNNLTLAGGSSGASLVLGQGATAADITFTPTGSGEFKWTGSTFRQTAVSPNSTGYVIPGYATGTNPDAGSSRGVSVDLINLSATNENGTALTFSNSNQLSSAYIFGQNLSHAGRTGNIIFGTANGSAPNERARITSTGNLLIGTISETGLTGAGGLKVDSTTSGSSGAGALVVTGGISVGAGINASSHFGGKLEITGEGSTNYGTANPVLYLKRYTSPNGNFLVFQGRTAYTTYIGTIGTAAGIATTNDDLVIGVTGNAPTFAITASTGAATFAGAVTGNSTFSSGVLSTTAGGYKLFDANGYFVNFRPTGARTYVIEGDASGNDYLTSFTNAGGGKHNLAASGTLAIGGNVGFYNASPVAKPTSVAVTAAAIHAALVTLNLIAA